MNGSSNFLEAFAARLRAGDRSGVDSSTTEVRSLRSSGPVLGRISPTSDRRIGNRSSGKRAGAGPCACDGKRTVSPLRKAR